MYNLMLDIVQKGDGHYFSETPEVFIYAFLGFAIVFAGIVVIIAVIWLMGLLMRKTDNFTFKNLKDKKTENGQASLQPAESDELPDETKAAIIAAVLAYCETCEPKREFKVKRIKRL